MKKVIIAVLVAMLVVGCSSTNSENADRVHSVQQNSVIFRCGISPKGDFFAFLVNGTLVEAENPGMALILATPGDTLFYRSYKKEQREYGMTELVEVDRTGINMKIPY